MGGALGLPQAVESIVVKRCTDKLCRVGFAEMNGWRDNMEDAHIVHLQDKWGFFGVFDGHGGQQCSAFIAKRLEEELQKASDPPADDAAVLDLMLRLDKEFLDTRQPSGSTGTFAIVQPQDGGKYAARVGNIGDSRVLLGRADGTMVQGSGTDGGLTTDHKPDHPAEKERIYRTGGHVKDVMGVARVNGDLAVSRSFGDAVYKQTGGPRQVDHPVSAEPEFTAVECSETDFLVLVCDGISEGMFPNRDVIKLIASELKQTASDTGKADPGAAAIAVCREALRCGSKDNLSCMIVLFGSNGSEPSPMKKALMPGSLKHLDNEDYREAYAAMARHAGMDIIAAIEMRHDELRKEKAERLPGGAVDQEMEKELAELGEGPPSDLEAGSEKRREWFLNWLQERKAISSTSLNSPELTRMQEDAKVCEQDKLRFLVEATPTLNWHERLSDIAEDLVTILRIDSKDDTAQVRWPARDLPLNGRKPMVVWLPRQALTPIAEDDMDPLPPVIIPVCVKELELLKKEVQSCESLEWCEDLGKYAGKEGLLVKMDDDTETACIQFGLNSAKPEADADDAAQTQAVWLPLSALAMSNCGSPEEDMLDELLESGEEEAKEHDVEENVDESERSHGKPLSNGEASGAADDGASRPVKRRRCVKSPETADGTGREVEPVGNP
eukprot:TRINITY_DN2337_c0_g2_i1.p1 TRINITY_DN2337_c0_g2~~TRINITY_DN2337_c0_g2_i1.p1  ORF type:complete len:668 (+),score=146.88 TRINITY_DN2337_c0_g2_i1:74-2077(+)